MIDKIVKAVDSFYKLAAGPSKVDLYKVMDAIRQEAKTDADGALLRIKNVRARVNMSKEQFDNAMLALSSMRLISLHHTDLPSVLSDEEREQLVVDSKGTYYIGVAEKPLPKIEEE